MAMKKAETKKTPLIYVTRDIERALGCEPAGRYFIVANRTPYSESIRGKYPDNVFLIDAKTDSGDILDTFDLLKAGEKIIQKIGGDILVFKNTTRIEELCAEKKWNLLNPQAALAEEIENKITQVKWLGAGKTGAGKTNAEQYLPPHAVKKVSDIQLKGEKIGGVSAPFMIQWGHGHTGEGTIFIADNKTGEKTLTALREKFPKRDARVTSYINGPIFTANICVKDDILVGNISSQITGMLPFTDNPWTTVGNDWSLPHGILSEEKIAQFHEIARAVGERMRESGWVGLFGIDCIYDVERDNLHLIEVNARQPASTTYESQLQEKIRAFAPDHFKNSMTIFEAHLATLQNQKNTAKKFAEGLIEINDGAQIIMRIPALKEIKKTGEEINEISASLRAKKYTVIEYANTKPGDDLIRIQSDRGILESVIKFNARGKEILEIVTGVAAEYDTI